MNEEKVVVDESEKGKSEGKSKERKTKKEIDGGEKSEDNSCKEDEESDKDKEVPLLDQPLEKSGKRERKNVQRFNEEFAIEPKETVCYCLNLFSLRLRKISMAVMGRSKKYK